MMQGQFDILNRSNPLKVVTKVVAVSKKTVDTMLKINGEKHVVLPAVTAQLLDVALPSDEMLQSMDILMTKQLSGVEIQEFYDTCWKDAGFFESWLEQDGKLDISVGAWEHGDFVGAWDGEPYPQKRLVTYMYKRDPGTMGYALGKPEVVVRSTHYCRTIDNDRSIITMTLNCDGEVLSDCFQVQIRGVATRLGESDIVINFAVFVVFTKTSLIAGKIRDGCRSATHESMLDLFQHIKTALGASEVPRQALGVVEDEDDGDTESMVCDRFWPFCRNPPVPTFMDDIDQEMHRLRRTLDLVLHLPASEDDDKAIQIVSYELAVVHVTLDNLLSPPNATNMQEQAGETAKTKKIVFLPFLRAMYGQFRPTRLMVLLSSKPSKAAAQYPILEHMTVFISEEAAGTVQDAYNVLRARQFHTSCLEERSKDVHVGNWEPEPSGDGRFVEPWSAEEFDLKRKVSYTHELTARDLIDHSANMYTVTHTHYLRMEGEDKLVFNILIETQGVWFSDSVSFQVRWVVTRVEEGTILIKVGIFLVQRKKTLMARKIRAEATRGVSKNQKCMLERLKTALGSVRAVSSGRKVPTDHFDDSKSRIHLLLRKWAPWIYDQTRFYPGSLISGDDDLRNQIRAIESKLRATDVILAGRVPGERAEDTCFYLLQLVIIQEALDNIICWFADHEQEQHALLRKVVIGL